MSNSIKKLNSTIPKSLNPEYNRVLAAFLLAIANSDDEIATQIGNLKDQLFVKTSSGKYLVNNANSLGVDKPPTIGLSDELFRQLIPNLSLKPKQIKKAFYDTSDVFWGPLYSRANISSNNSTPFTLNIGDTFIINIDGKDNQQIKVNSEDMETDGSPTNEEILLIFNKFQGLTPSFVTNPAGGEFLNLRTDTPGSVGSIEIIGGTGFSASKLDFDLVKKDILDIEQRVSIYNINPNELIIELPITLPALTSGLKGSHHFHEDSSIESPVAPENGVWQGSFFFSRLGIESNFTITGQIVETQQNIVSGNVYTELQVDDSSIFENSSGYLMFNFGLSQEGPIKYVGKNDTTNIIFLDPSYVFENTHVSGSKVNFISNLGSLKPRITGEDLAIYLNSPSASSNVVRELLESLKAAGIVIKFEILSPEFKYLIDTPYISEDNAPNT